jgi:hypothetical protein
MLESPVRNDEISLTAHLQERITLVDRLFLREVTHIGINYECGLLNRYRTKGSHNFELHFSFHQKLHFKLVAVLLLLSLEVIY